MTRKLSINAQWVLPIAFGASLLAFIFLAQPVGAINRLPTPDPQPGSYGLEATKPQDPPKVAASISTPGNGASFTTSPITVTGICTTGLLVQIYNNGVMVGAVMCQNNAFSLEVSLFAGTNELSAIVYDDLEQAGPVSNIATVTYNDSRLTAFGQLISLTSSYGRRASPVTTQLTWPLQLTGGAGPYAFSIDWGDGTPAELKSQSLAGLINIAHTYKKAGIYQVNVRVTDTNGVSAFIQLIAVSSGKVEEAAAAAKDTGTIVKVIWIPAVLTILMLIPAFWLGRRSQLTSIRNKMIKERDSYQSDN